MMNTMFRRKLIHVVCGNAIPNFIITPCMALGKLINGEFT